MDIQHNHDIDIAAAVNLLSPSQDVKNKFQRLFADGLSPSKAIKKHEDDLRADYKENFFLVLADRTINPDARWVYNYFYQCLNRKYGELKGEELLKTLKNQIDCINQNYGQKCAAISIDESRCFTIALMTPLMKRTARTPLAGDICFLDSSGKMDKYDCRVFLLMVTSPIGGLPVGVFITTNESEEAITQGLDLHRSLLDSECFGGRGTHGPQIFMTDYSDAEINSLAKIYPSASLFLCIFHVLAAVWKWLRDAENLVNKDDRPILYGLMRKLLYANSKEEFDAVIDEMNNHTVLQKYDNVINYFNHWVIKQDSWAMFNRGMPALRGCNTNNIVEAAFRVLIEKVLDRTKAFSPVQLLEFLQKDFNDHYETKILKAINSKPDAYLEKKASINEKKCVKEMDCYKFRCLLPNSVYEVFNMKNNKTYEVNADLSVCTCPVGHKGAPCKHFSLIGKHFPVRHILHLPSTEQEKKDLHFVATGVHCEKRNWYGALPFKTNAAATCNENTLLLEKNKISKLDIFKDEKLPGIDPTVGSVVDDDDDDDEEDREFRNAVKTICDLAKEKPDVYRNARRSFCKQFKKMKTDAAIVTALICFGKFSGYRKASYAGSTKIGVQHPERRVGRGRGKRALQSGRPHKTTLQERREEGKCNPQLFPKKNKRSKAPHSLQSCVEQNSSLGKSSCKKMKR